MGKPPKQGENQGFTETRQRLAGQAGGRAEAVRELRGVLLPGAQWLVTAHAPGSLGTRCQLS
ncbi:hypothetical protein [Nonomuraea bangladeshensis]|uniref:hypothetical protein n=1 Tax=Nonomuraea bangladeshensis TaxID=404385 RepID=UPI003C2B9103